jgi:hypothetical protein
VFTKGQVDALDQHNRNSRNTKLTASCQEDLLVEHEYEGLNARSRRTAKSTRQQELHKETTFPKPRKREKEGVSPTAVTELPGTSRDTHMKVMETAMLDKLKSQGRM